MEKESIFKKAWVRSVVIIVVILLIFGGFIYWRANAHTIKIDNATIDAPIINLSPSVPGALSDIYVHVGDMVAASTPVARVGDEILLSKVGGLIVSVNHQEGQIFTSATPVVSMINTSEERVVGKIDEDKGLADIKVGQPVSFTVDAFGSKKFSAVVEEVSPISNQSGVVFNISDKREIKQFNIKARFNISDYSILKEGMSAKMTIFTN
jgi:multidrug resistance efflux pump